MGHGLKFPSDLATWQRWQQRRKLRRLVTLARGNSAPSPLTIRRGSGGADILVVVDSANTSGMNAIQGPLRHISPERLTLVMGPDVTSPLPGKVEVLDPSDARTALNGVRVLIGGGHYTPAGSALWPHATAAAIRTFVSQHGALTPFAPPLPSGATLLSWSEEDGEFWRSGRSDVTSTPVGAQLLWAAGNASPNSTSASAPLTYLGQGHGAEIPRPLLIEAALRFCRTHDATYRPHPSEKDRLSRMAHAGYRRAGIRIDTAGAPLATWDGPVVSIFSTGVLEMAARGVDAWVDFPRPPAWLGEFWERYGMRRFGGAPTPAPTQPAQEPARRIAEILMEAAR